MPELPEVEIIKKSLTKVANNTKIISIKINNFCIISDKNY